MKNFAVVLLLVAALALGALAWHQKNRLAQTRAQLAETQNQLSEKSGADERVAQAERKSKALQDTLVATSKFADEQSKQAEQLQQSLAAAKTNGANPFAEMFKDPKMKEMLKSSQKAVLGPMIDKQYAALFQQLNLTPEQSATLKDLLQRKMSAGTDAGMAMLDGSLDAAQRADLAKQIKSQSDDFDAQIKQFLGEDNYPAFQAYEKTTADRMTVSQFNDQFAGGANALSPDQQQQLILAMSDERNNFKWTADYSNKNALNGDIGSMFSEERINQFTKEREQLDRQTLDRVRPILTLEQFDAFQQFQTSQRELQLAGMKMAAQMFAPK